MLLALCVNYATTSPTPVAPTTTTESPPPSESHLGALRGPSLYGILAVVIVIAIAATCITVYCVTQRSNRQDSPQPLSYVLVSTSDVPGQVPPSIPSAVSARDLVPLFSSAPERNATRAGPRVELREGAFSEDTNSSVRRVSVRRWVEETSTPPGSLLITPIPSTPVETNELPSEDDDVLSTRCPSVVCSSHSPALSPSHRPLSPLSDSFNFI